MNLSPAILQVEFGNSMTLGALLDGHDGYEVFCKNPENFKFLPELVYRKPENVHIP